MGAQMSKESPVRFYRTDSSRMGSLENNLFWSIEQMRIWDEQAFELQQSLDIDQHETQTGEREIPTTRTGEVAGERGRYESRGRGDIRGEEPRYEGGFERRGEQERSSTGTGIGSSMMSGISSGLSKIGIGGKEETETRREAGHEYQQQYQPSSYGTSTSTTSAPVAVSPALRGLNARDFDFDLAKRVLSKINEVLPSSSSGNGTGSMLSSEKTKKKSFGMFGKGQESSTSMQPQQSVRSMAEKGSTVNPTIVAQLVAPPLSPASRLFSTVSKRFVLNQRKIREIGSSEYERERMKREQQEFGIEEREQRGDEEKYALESEERETGTRRTGTTGQYGDLSRVTSNIVNDDDQDTLEGKVFQSLYPSLESTYGRQQQISINDLPSTTQSVEDGLNQLKEDVLAKFLFIHNFFQKLLDNSINTLKAKQIEDEYHKKLRPAQMENMSVLERLELRKRAMNNSNTLINSVYNFDRSRRSLYWLIQNYMLELALFNANSQLNKAHAVQNVLINAIHQDFPLHQCTGGTGSSSRESHIEAPKSYKNCSAIGLILTNSFDLSELTQVNRDRAEYIQVLESVLNQFYNKKYELYCRIEENEKESLAVGVDSLDRNLNGFVEANECPSMTAKVFHFLANDKDRITPDGLISCVNYIQDNIKTLEGNLNQLEMQRNFLRTKSHQTETDLLELENMQQYFDENETELIKSKKLMRSIFRYFYLAFSMHLFNELPQNIRPIKDKSKMNLGILTHELRYLQEEMVKDPLEMARDREYFEEVLAQAANEIQPTTGNRPVSERGRFGPSATAAGIGSPARKAKPTGMEKLKQSLGMKTGEEKQKKLMPEKSSTTERVSEKAESLGFGPEKGQSEGFIPQRQNPQLFQTQKVPTGTSQEREYIGRAPEMMTTASGGTVGSGNIERGIGATAAGIGAGAGSAAMMSRERGERGRESEQIMGTKPSHTSEWMQRQSKQPQYQYSEPQQQQPVSMRAQRGETQQYPTDIQQHQYTEQREARHPYSGLGEQQKQQQYPRERGSEQYYSQQERERERERELPKESEQRYSRESGPFQYARPSELQQRYSHEQKPQGAQYERGTQGETGTQSRYSHYPKDEEQQYRYHQEQQPIDTTTTRASGGGVTEPQRAGEREEQLRQQQFTSGTGTGTGMSADTSGFGRKWQPISSQFDENEPTSKQPVVSAEEVEEIPPTVIQQPFLASSEFLGESDMLKHQPVTTQYHKQEEPTGILGETAGKTSSIPSYQQSYWDSQKLSRGEESYYPKEHQTTGATGQTEYREKYDPHSQYYEEGGRGEIKHA